MTVDEAVRAARTAIDELDSILTPEAGAALINRIDAYREVIEASQPENPWLLYISASTLSWTGRQGDAVDLLQRFVETREGRNEWRAYRLLGDLFVTEFPRLALGYYRNAHALKRDEPAVLFGLSRCAAKIGEYQDATRYAEQAVEASGRTNVVHLTHLARVLMAQRRWAEARTEAATALRLAEKAAHDQADQRNPLFTVDQQYQLIIEVIGGLISDAPDVIQHYLDAAAYIQARGQNAAKLNLHEALQVLEQAVNRTSDNAVPKLIEEYGRVLAEVGRTDDAVAQFEKLLLTDPANPIATEWLRKLRPGKAKPVDAAGESRD
ncbi:MAG: tetratricopeptide repeat protein [Planctomycetes bacterium]|nr:tetratricopeptide repeat protein [Planctomycetota bacterium]